MVWPNSATLSLDKNFVDITKLNLKGISRRKLHIVNVLLHTTDNAEF